MSAALGRRLRDINLSLPKCDVLSTLIEREGLSQQDLAEQLSVTKGNISGLIDRLTTAGLVERRSIEGDRRAHALFLTTQGRQLALKGIAIQRAFVATTLGRLPPTQLAQMEALLALTRETLRQSGAAPKRDDG
jgi:DNA-binding MarR family transcriptional regulator